MESIKNLPPTTLFQAHGGKFKKRKWIISHFPKHYAYIEPFCGAASVLFAKPKSPVEIINDTNKLIVNAFEVMRDPVLYEELKRKLFFTPYSRDVLKTKVDSKDKVGQAWMLIIKSRMQMNVLDVNPSFSTGYSRKKPSDAHIKFQEFLPFFHNRLRKVVIENIDAFKLIKMHSKPSAMYYMDPPYHPHSYSASKKSNRFDKLSRKKHLELLDIILDHSSQIAISGYYHEDYDVLTDNNWILKKKETSTGIAYTGEAKTKEECLWLNPRLVKNLKRQGIKI